METYERHQRIWYGLQGLVSRLVSAKFHMTHEDVRADGPILLIPNHVNAWDPILVSTSLRNKQVYFVASEHIFRLGFLTRLLAYMFGPIPRRKASNGADTVKACLRHLRAGHSICLFAEGEQSWDGLTQPIFSATGKLVKSSGATLVTYRLEGAYLSLPRWGRGIRRGKIHGHPVRVYPPEELKGMSPAEINAAINRDLFEDAWARQREHPVAYRGRKPADGLERMLFLCPRCRKIGTLRSRKDRLSCSCGLSVRYLETGFLEGAEPFETLADWEVWQQEAIRTLDRSGSEPLFSDEGLQLSRIGSEHAEEALGTGTLTQYGDRLCCCGMTFPLAEIGNMAMVQANLLLFTCGERYYQIRANKKSNVNLRKYLALWKET